MFGALACIVIVELCERIGLNTLVSTMKSWLQNQGFSNADSSSVHQIFTLLSFSCCFLGGWLAETKFGRYKTVRVCHHLRDRLRPRRSGDAARRGEPLDVEHIAALPRPAPRYWNLGRRVEAAGGWARRSSPCQLLVGVCPSLPLRCPGARCARHGRCPTRFDSSHCAARPPPLQSNFVTP